jgi:hypothetical protein
MYIQFSSDAPNALGNTQKNKHTLIADNTWHFAPKAIERMR